MIKNIWEHWQTTAVAIASLIVTFLPQIFPQVHLTGDTAKNLGIVIFFIGLLFARDWRKK